MKPYKALLVGEFIGIFTSSLLMLVVMSEEKLPLSNFMMRLLMWQHWLGAFVGAAVGTIILAILTRFLKKQQV